MPTTRHITDLSDEEVLKLTDDDLKRIIQLRMLEEGIKIISAPEEPKYAPVPAKDLLSYMVKIDHTILDMHFADREAAERVAEAIRAEQPSLRKTAYMGGSYYERTIEASNEKPEIVIEEALYYSKELFLKLRESIESNKKLKEAYEKELREYQDVSSAARQIRDEVNDRFYEVAETNRKQEATLAKFNEYLVLADNDPYKATTFFNKAYSPDVETQAYLAKRTEDNYVLPATQASKAEQSTDDE